MSFCFDDLRKYLSPSKRHAAFFFQAADRYYFWKKLSAIFNFFLILASSVNNPHFFFEELFGNFHSNLCIVQNVETIWGFS